MPVRHLLEQDDQQDDQQDQATDTNIHERSPLAPLLRIKTPDSVDRFLCLATPGWKVGPLVL